MLEEYGISNSAYELINECEKELVDVFKRIDSICEVNSLKVLNASSSTFSAIVKRISLVVSLKSCTSPVLVE